MPTSTHAPLLKTFCKSVMRIEVEVIVSLAEKQMKIDELLDLVPGAMIPFTKPCTAPLTLEIGGHPIASGEVVKVGDKFGIRIKEILRPAERFVTLTGREPTAEEMQKVESADPSDGVPPAQA